MNCPRCNSSRWEYGCSEVSTISYCLDCGLAIEHLWSGGAAMCDNCNEKVDANTYRGCKCYPGGSDA